MKPFSKDHYERARAWLMAHGRPLDRALFAFSFEGGGADKVAAELTAYRNADGGFGHALEPDVRLDDSSVIATTVGLQVLRTLHADASHPLVGGAIAYLLAQLDREALAWADVPPNVDDAPHAPWWNAPDKPTGFTANPGAEIVGHFHHWAEIVPADLLAPLTDAAMAHLHRHANDLSMHDVFCYERLRKTEALPAEQREEILRIIRGAVSRIIETDPAKWPTYCARPLQMAASPDSPYFESLRDAVDANLDYLIDSQQPDGAWAPWWSWGPDGGEVWERSKREWQGAFIIEHVRMLLAFSRLEVLS